ncbi:MAG: glycine cleavage system protein GcvH [Chthoniobacteraceae bacterium]
MNVPDDLKYTETHEWIRIEGDTARIGVTDHAQEELTDVVFVELPTVGDKVAAGASIAVVESVKSAGDIYAPVSGTIVAVNEALADSPALVNTDPYGEGWLFALKLDAPEEVAKLQDAAAYRALLGE